MYLIYNNIEGFYFCVLGSSFVSAFLFKKSNALYYNKRKKIKNHVVHACLKMRTKVWTQITLDLFSGGFRYWPLLLSFSNVFQNAFLLSWLSKSKKLIILGSICDTPLPNWYISGLKKKKKKWCVLNFCYLIVFLLREVSFFVGHLFIYMDVLIFIWILLFIFQFFFMKIFSLHAAGSGKALKLNKSLHWVFQGKCLEVTWQTVYC